MKIVDCHVHLVDTAHNSYPHLAQTNEVFSELAGDYAAFPRHYLIDDYLKDTEGFEIEKSVMVEFMSTDPLKEAKWAEHLHHPSGQPQAIVALVNFSDPQAEKLLEQYWDLPKVRAVRQHLLWHPQNPKERFASSPHILRDHQFRKNFAKLREYGFGWEFEIFDSQIPDAIDLAESFPDIEMVLHPMGWPSNLSLDGFHFWKKQMHAISHCENVTLKITGISAIFKNWTIEDIQPWIREAIEIFTPSRTMISSNMPFERLGDHTFQKLYQAFFEIVKDLSEDDKQKIFNSTASRWYSI